MEQDLTPQIQKHLLKIFKVYDAICREHNLRYYAIGGTALGAVRHQGFIPWDDDMDLAMPMEDFLEFRRIAETELPEPYVLLDPDKVRLCPAAVTFKMHDSGTTHIAVNTMDYPERYIGVFIDIFPLSGMPRGRREKIRFIKEMDRCLHRNMLLRLPLSYKKKIEGKLYWLAMRPLLWFKPYNYYTKRIEELGSKWPFDNSEMIHFSWRQTARPWKKGFKYKTSFYTRDFLEAAELPFEDTVMRVPAGYDSYLTREFGDYMKLPPKEQQVSRHPTVVLDLEHSYREYASGERPVPGVTGPR